MRDLQTIAAECLKKCDEVGIPYGTIYKFEPNTRARGRWGLCKKVNDGFEININVDLLDERNPIEAAENTVLHEILHTCEGCMNHGKKWRMYAERLNRRYGYEIKRVSTQEEKGLNYHRPEAHKDFKYMMKCATCGASVKRRIESDFVKFPYMYYCRHCGKNKWERITL